MVDELRTEDAFDYLKLKSFDTKEKGRMGE